MFISNHGAIVDAGDIAPLPTISEQKRMPDLSLLVRGFHAIHYRYLLMIPENTKETFLKIDHGKVSIL